MFGHVRGLGRSAEFEATYLQGLVWGCLAFLAVGLIQNCEIFFARARYLRAFGLAFLLQARSVVIPSGSSGPRCQAWRKRPRAQAGKVGALEVSQEASKAQSREI